MHILSRERSACHRWIARALFSAVTVATAMSHETPTYAEDDIGDWPWSSGVFSESMALTDHSPWSVVDRTRPHVNAQYSSRLYPRENVEGQSHKLGLVDHDLRLSASLFKDEIQHWALTQRTRVLDLYTSARVPGTRDSLPENLWDLRLGTSYSRELDNGWRAGCDLSVGSASDSPFASVEELTTEATIFTRIPDGKRNAWHLYLNYSNNREYLRNIPIPGVGYEFFSERESKPWVSGCIGFPVSHVRLFAPPVDFRASYEFPRSIDTEIALSGYFAELYTGFEWTNQRFFRSDRHDRDDRLFFDEKRIKVGLRTIGPPIGKSGRVVLIEIEGGYAFDRAIYEAEYYQDRGDSFMSISDGPYFMVQFRITL